MPKTCSGAAFAALATLGFAIFPAPAGAVSGACNKTTAAAATACGLAAGSDYNYALGTCANLGSAAARQDCQTRAGKDLVNADKLCVAQASARQSICNAAGQAPYNPIIRPADFSTVIDNPLLPMTPGSVYVYSNAGENAEVTITVTSDTIKLAGVTCLVVHDVNRVDGEIEEDTLDYFAQHKDGSVWYFGEDTISYDNGVASTKGSWRAGLNGAKPGIVMFAAPTLGTTYRQEFLLGEAEDVARAVAFNQHVKVPAGTFTNAFQTKDFTAIEPGKVENKYYVPGIGNVLVVNPATGEREELESFTPGP